jgi:hypothetical protein
MAVELEAKHDNRGEVDSVTLGAYRHDCLASRYPGPPSSRGSGFGTGPKSVWPMMSHLARMPSDHLQTELHVSTKS